MSIQAKNEIRMKVLSDGTVSIDTDSFEEEVHDSAAQLIEETVELLGGERKITENKDIAHSHSHLTGHVHGRH